MTHMQLFLQLKVAASFTMVWYRRLISVLAIYKPHLADS